MKHNVNIVSCNSLWLSRPGALSTICLKQTVISWGCTSDSSVVTTLRKLNPKKGFSNRWMKKTCLGIHLDLTMEKERSVEVVFANDLPTASWWWNKLWKLKKIINSPMMTFIWTACLFIPPALTVLPWHRVSHDGQRSLFSMLTCVSCAI